jgi:ribose transport system permease protein
MKEDDKTMQSKSNKLKKMLIMYPQLGTAALFIIVIIVFTVFSPMSKAGIPIFITGKNINSILEQTAGISIAAFGMTLVLLVGGIDLSMGAVLGLVGVISSHLLEKYQWNTGIVIGFCLLMGAIIGFSNGFLIVWGKALPFLITLGMMNVVRGLAYMISQGESTYVTNQLFRMVFVRSEFLGISVLIWWTCFFLIIMFLLVSNTKFGRRTQAIGGNEEAALNSGVRVKQVKILVYTLSGFIASFVGMITVARLGNGMPSVGEGFEMNAIAAAVLGGTTFSGDGGNMLGTLLGSLVIGTVVNGLTILGVNSYVQTVVKGLIIIATVVGSMSISRKR